MDEIRLISPLDILVWPDGTWCFREDQSLYQHYPSSDYIVLIEGTAEAETFLEKEYT